MPIFFGLQRPISGRRPRITVVDERHAVPYEYVVFDRHTFADEGVTRNLATLPDFGVLLDFDEGPDFRIVAHLASIQIDKIVDLHIFAELDVRRDALPLTHAYTASPFPFRDSSAASSMRTILNPAKPSFMGRSPDAIHWTK